MFHKILEHNAAANRAKHIVKHTSLGSFFFFLLLVPKPERTPVITRFWASNDSLTPSPGPVLSDFPLTPVSDRFQRTRFLTFPPAMVSVSRRHITLRDSRQPPAVVCPGPFYDLQITKKKRSVITNIFSLMAALFRRFPF